MSKFHFEIRVTETLVGSRYFEVDGEDRASARRALWKAFSDEQDGEPDFKRPTCVMGNPSPGSRSTFEPTTLIPEASEVVNYQTDLINYDEDGREIAGLMAEG